MVMPFDDDVVAYAWSRSGERCENCNRPLSWSARGQENSMGWEAHHVDENGPATLGNCRILCQDCHKKTRSYGS